MDITEITGFKTGIDRGGVNFLDPSDAFETLRNGYIYRQELLSRKGFRMFSTGRLAGETRVMGIFENILPNGIKELLVIDKNFLYSYNSGTDTFDQIPTAGSLGVGFSFGITDNEDYVSGTSYFTGAGSQRFIFTGRGMSDVYFYDGTDVKSFTTVADNPDYQAPASGTLSRATNVIWFGERLNIFQPVIAGLQETQGVLFSAIKDSSGNGDKFNSPGAGLLSADTAEDMRGAIINGNLISMGFERSSWTLEKTRDAFNPYLIKKVPSVLGSDATFSIVTYAGEVKSAGKTGMISTDGRSSLRFDNKIPNLTRDEIEQTKFALTYGGFDRELGQFLFTYLSSAGSHLTSTQDTVLAYNYEENSWSQYDQRFSVFGQTTAGETLVWNDIDETQNPSWGRMDTTEEVWNKIGIGEQVQKTLAGDDDGFIYELNQDFDDYFVAISNITQAASAVVTIDESAFKDGDRILFKNVEGMTEINGLIGDVITATATSLTVNIDSTLMTAYSTAGTASKPIDFQARLAPFNPYRANGRKVYVSHIEFLLNPLNAPMFVDLFEDEEDDPFKTSELITDSTIAKKKEWITVTVNQESSFITFLLRQESGILQSLVTSIRIHSKAGALNSN